MAHWVQDPTAAALVAMEVQLQSLARYSGLSIQCCHSCDAGQSCGSDLTPGLGTSICHGCGEKKKAKQRQSSRSTV